MPTRALERLASARLYLVCDELPDMRLRAALAGGVDIVQLRMKSAPDRRILTVARRYADACAEHRALLVINDRPDLAIKASAAGVHLGQSDMALARARELVGPGRLIGLSTHTRQQIEAASTSDADYIGVGPVYATPTKPAAEPVGVELVRYAAMHASRPFFAIGGIDLANVASVAAAGAHGIAVIRALTEAPDPQEAAERLRSALQ
ncbi:MAG: thiamine phosphate synthase [Solirubrobacteraceae bacterium]